MHSCSYSMQLMCVIVAACLLLSNALPAIYFQEDGGLTKKSDMQNFVSAMRGASRLRYGKRSIGDEFDDSGDAIYPVRMLLTKRRMQGLPELIDSLNGAERLRFGK
ncbi:hypothetical protein M3Y99_01108900 [Aphelenchoides fujianensis]|nr:hypothetical protein M3Y99_01108900 [Aphelenchoides fujianensis]